MKVVEVSQCKSEGAQLAESLSIYAMFASGPGPLYCLFNLWNDSNNSESRHGEFCEIKSKFTQARNEEIQEVKKKHSMADSNYDYDRHMRMERIDLDRFDYV